ncbi:MAG: chromate transporter [Ruminococcaceae bacterium]|nr:chromate transporter [Oscillospiraceae bacterium]
MKFLMLFLTFLKIGAVAFGGGYGIIAFIRDECLSKGWFTDEELLNFIAISESTPGPIAVNMATFVGSAQGGFFGAFLATLGVVLPAFIIVFLVATIFTRLLKYRGVKAALNGIRPAVIALILGTSAVMFLSNIFGIQTVSSAPVFDFKALAVLAAVVLISFIYKKFKSKTVSPILLIVISGALGVLLYGI